MRGRCMVGVRLPVSLQRVDDGNQYGMVPLWYCFFRHFLIAGRAAVFPFSFIFNLVVEK